MSERKLIICETCNGDGTVDVDYNDEGYDDCPTCDGVAVWPAEQETK